MNQSHPRVRHPGRAAQPSSKFLVRANNWAALRLAAFYGAAATIWLFAVYSLFGALVSQQQQVTMLYWSNAAQLVFCPLMVYVGNLLGRGQQAKADADHEALTHIALAADAILKLVSRPKERAQ
ncbi:MAG TPA: hypothetical protein VIX86_20590 [Streptosporangiaceae bacterium]